MQSAVSVSNIRNKTFALPYLTIEVERSLLEKAQNNCKASALRLAESHFRFVSSIARKFSSYGVDVDDLFQQGCIGLMKAIQTFDLSRPNIRLAAHAAIHIKSEIINYVLDNVRCYRMATTAEHKKLFFNLRKYWSGDDQRSFNTSEIAQIAEDLNVSVKDVQAMEVKMRNYDAPVAVSDDDEVEWGSAGVHISDETTNPLRMVLTAERSELVDKVKDAVGKLSERDQTIIYWRLIAEDKKHLHELATELGVSAERVRQLEAQATGRLRKLVEHLR